MEYDIYKQSCPTFYIRHCELFQTCVACPEQYDVFYNEARIGYLRLRHGRFTAEYPDVGGITVLICYPPDDCDGMFCDDEIRVHYLAMAVQACLDAHIKKTEQ